MRFPVRDFRADPTDQQARLVAELRRGTRPEDFAARPFLFYLFQALAARQLARALPGPLVRNEQLGDRARERQPWAFLLEPEELADRIDLQKDVLPIRGEDEICGAVVEAQAPHEREKAFLDLGREPIRLPLVDESQTMTAPIDAGLFPSLGIDGRGEHP